MQMQRLLKSSSLTDFRESLISGAHETMTRSNNPKPSIFWFGEGGNWIPAGTKNFCVGLSDAIRRLVTHRMFRKFLLFPSRVYFERTRCSPLRTTSTACLISKSKGLRYRQYSILVCISLRETLQQLSELILGGIGTGNAARGNQDDHKGPSQPTASDVELHMVAMLHLSHQRSNQFHRKRGELPTRTAGKPR